MEKIIMAIIGKQDAASTIAFACYLAGLGRARLNAYFLESDDDGEDGLHEDDISGHIQEFIQKCNQRGIIGVAKRVDVYSRPGLLAETAFSDLLVIGSSTSPHDFEEEPPCSYVKDVLAGASCPVLVAPAVNEPPEEIVFCYDGSSSSIFAMKQLSYLFPEFTELKATVIQVREEGEMPEAEKKRVSTWLARHFGCADIVVLHGDAESQLWKFLLYKKNPLVVMGAYGRNFFSRFMQRSHADLIIKTIPQPMFITHF